MHCCSLQSLVCQTASHQTVRRREHLCLTVLWVITNSSTHTSLLSSVICTPTASHQTVRRGEQCAASAFVVTNSTNTHNYCFSQSLGRRRLAIKLLEEESSCALQVPLLLSLATRQTKKPGGVTVSYALSLTLCPIYSHTRAHTQCSLSLSVSYVYTQRAHTHTPDTI